MRSFYSPTGDARSGQTGPAAPVIDSASSVHAASAHSTSPINSRARIAVYDGPASAPRVEEITLTSVGDYIETLSSRIYELARGNGGKVPYTVVRELAENLIHADFAEPVVSILDDGNTIRFADQGPGILDKDRAVMPGFTTARGEMKHHIRGVGSGLPIVNDFLSVTGGKLLIEDNLGSGAVVTITAESAIPPIPAPEAAGASAMPDTAAPTGRREHPSFAFDDATSSEQTARPRLSTRQKHVLALVMESGAAGPSIVSRELNVGLSTAYRDLASLEDLGLISSVGGKRALTEKGMSFLDDALSSS